MASAAVFTLQGMMLVMGLTAGSHGDPSFFLFSADSCVSLENEWYWRRN